MEDQYYLLNFPKDTIMYLIQSDRIGQRIDTCTVKYQGFSKTQKDYCDDDPHIKEEYRHMSMPAVNVMFKKNNGENLTFIIDDDSRWSHFPDLHKFTTDQHLSRGGASNPYIDLYFTTDEDKFNNVVKKWKEQKRIDN